LRHPVRSCETNFVNGEKVYYKRAADNKWRGPAKVIGHLSTKVFVVHGSRVLRCSSSRVIPVNSTHTKGVSKDDISLEEDQTNSSDDELSIVALTPLAENSDNSDDETQVENISTQRIENEPGELRRSVRNRRAPARYIPEEGAWEPETQEANVVFIPVSRHGEPEVIAAKEAELENWKATEAVDTVDDTGQKLISTRWVVTEKEFAPGQFKPKARLVVRGFEETNEVQVDAPTASKAALRTVLAIAANKQWGLEHVDVKAAFLQGRKIERNVYVKPPEEAATDGKVWRLRKAAYGLVDAARNWYLSVKGILLQLGCVQSNLDKAVFRYYDKGELLGAIVLKERVKT